MVGGVKGERGFTAMEESGDAIVEEVGIGVRGETSLDGLDVHKGGGGGEEGGSGESGGDKSLADGSVGAPDDEGGIEEWKSDSGGEVAEMAEHGRRC